MNPRRTITADDLRDLKEKIAALQGIVGPMTAKTSDCRGGWWHGYLAGEFDIVIVRLNSLLSVALLDADRLIEDMETKDPQNAKDF